MVSHTHEHGRLVQAAECASVAVEIGDGRGALILYPSERFRGREIEISAADTEGHRVHTGVHERTTATRAQLTAIFGSLPAGQYLIWEDADTPGPVVSVSDGCIAEVTLS